MKLPLIAAGTLIAGMAGAAETPTLTVYTYDSFVAEYGPGPRIEPAFENRCGCDLKLVGAGDGAAVLSRLMLEGGRSDADLVLGLDTNLIHRAKESGLFAGHGLTDLPDFDMPVAWSDATFLPYDWGWFAFVYDSDRLDSVPDSFEALADLPDDTKIVIQDPRSSTPGLGLLYWVEAAYPERAGEIWRALAANILTVTKGWSEAYGLFLDGEAEMVLSYTTSPAFHRATENDHTIRAARFEEGHYMQIEMAGMLQRTDQPGLARDFLRFMLSDAFQSEIPTTNWMYPAVSPKAGLPEAFDGLIRPEPSLLLPPERAAALREQAIATWRNALSR